MRFHHTDGIYLIRLDRGEEVIRTLTTFCEMQHIQNAIFSGIGAVEKLTCGYYALHEKQYHFKEYETLLEVASLTGNVTLKEGMPFIHVHGVFTDTTNAAFGGHIVEMRVGVLLEVTLTPLQSVVSRAYDECIGLYLMEPENELDKT